MPSKEEIRKFSLLIEDLAVKLECNHIDAIIEHCNSTGLEVEVASTLISAALKAKIREDAQEINLIKKTAKLPI